MEESSNERPGTTLSCSGSKLDRNSRSSGTIFKSDDSFCRGMFFGGRGRENASLRQRLDGYSKVRQPPLWRRRAGTVRLVLAGFCSSIVYMAPRSCVLFLALGSHTPRLQRLKVNGTITVFLEIAITLEV